MTPRQATLMAVLAALWGASYLLIKIALEGFSPAAIVFGRTALGAAVLYGVIVVADAESRAALARARARPLLALGFSALAIAVPFLLISYGELRIPSGLTAVLIASAPLFVALYAPLLDREEVAGPRQVLGLLVGMLGVVLIVGVESIAGLAQLVSALAMVAAAACYSLASFMVKRSYSGFPPLALSLVSIGGGALLTLAPALLSAPTSVPALRPVVALIVLAVAGTAVTFVIFYRLIAELGPARSSVVAYLIPPVSLGYGALLLDEAVTASALAGLVAILTGVALASTQRPGPAPEGAEAGPAALSRPGSARPPGGAPPRKP